MLSLWEVAPADWRKGWICADGLGVEDHGIHESCIPFLEEHRWQSGHGRRTVIIAIIFCSDLCPECDLTGSLRL